MSEKHPTNKLMSFYKMQSDCWKMKTEYRMEKGLEKQKTKLKRRVNSIQRRITSFQRETLTTTKLKVIIELKALIFQDADLF